MKKFKFKLVIWLLNLEKYKKYQDENKKEGECILFGKKAKMEVGVCNYFSK